MRRWIVLLAVALLFSVTQADAYLTSGRGGSHAGGSNGQLQYNANGTLAGTNGGGDCTWDGTLLTFTCNTGGGIMSAQSYGAVGDAIFSGDGIRNSGLGFGDDGAITTTTLTSANAVNFFPPNGFVGTAGEHISIQGAGAGGGLYMGLVASVTDATHLVVSPAVSTSVTHATYLLQNADGVTSGTTFTSASGAFTSAMVGDLIFIDFAGAGSTLYQGTVTGFNSPTSLTVSPTIPLSMTNVHYAIGKDNTTALQNWINAIKNANVAGNGPSGYLPKGIYLHRGLDLGAMWYLHISGAGGNILPGGYGIGGSTLLCVAPTTNPKVCHDFSGDSFIVVRDIQFAMGTSDLEAGKVNVLLSRLDGTYYGIFDTFENVVFHASGGASAYNVYNYSAEQNSFINDVFNYNWDTARAYYSGTLNTPNISSPTHGALTTTLVSTSVNNFSGGATQFSANGAPAITVDGQPMELNIDGGYVRLNGAYDDFIVDTGTSSFAGDFNLRGVRVEPDASGSNATPSNHVFNLAGTWSGGSIIGGEMMWAGNVTTPSVPFFKAKTILGTSIMNFVSNAYPNPEIVATTSEADNQLHNINSQWTSLPYDTNFGVPQHLFSGGVQAEAFRRAPLLFSQLPTCNAVEQGLHVFITDDSAACTFGTVATGGGAIPCPVGCDGTNWKTGY
jgi:hypothetical protein